MGRAAAALLAALAWVSVAAGQPTFGSPLLCVQDDGAPIACRPRLNFDANVSCVDDPANNRVTCTGSAASAGVTPRKDTFGCPAATLVLAVAPLANSEQPFVDGFALRRVASAPGLNEYTLAGTTATLGTGTCATGSTAWIDYLQ